MGAPESPKPRRWGLDEVGRHYPSLSNLSTVVNIDCRLNRISDHLGDKSVFIEKGRGTPNMGGTIP